MNRLGMMIDISHVSYGVMHAALDTTKAPLIFSHSSSDNVTSHHRNVKDDVLRRLVENRGIIMVNVYTEFAGETIDDIISMSYQKKNNQFINNLNLFYLDHINHIKSIVGPDYIGIGADYDGIPSTPIGLEDVSKYPDLFDKLAESGHGYEPWTRDELKKLAGLNLLRVFGEVENVRDQMEAEGILPYEANIPDIDLSVETNTDTCRTGHEEY